MPPLSPQTAKSSAKVTTKPLVTEIRSMSFAIRKNPHDNPRRSRDRLLAEGGLSAFAQQAEFLSEVWFGGAAPTAVTNQMTSYILRGGLYGSMENRITVQQQKQGGKLRYAASRIFLPYDTLKHHYPVLEQHRWLTPLMEVRRWGKLVFCGGLKRSVRELRCNSATPRQQASETQSLLSVLNL